MGVLVTGGTGFVGRHLIGEIRRRGLRVAATGLVAAEGADGPVDVRDPEAVRDMVRGARPDAVVHLAAQSSAAVSFRAPQETFEVNVLGTLNVLAAVRELAPRARLLIVTSAELYGPSTPDLPHRETSPMNPRSPYGASKAAQDLLAAMAGEAYGLDVVRARPFSHTGPGQHERFALPAFATQIAAIERGEREPVLRVGDLTVVRDYLDVRDVVRAYADLLEKGQAREAYNVAGGRGWPLRELVEKLTANSQVRVAIEEDPGRLRPADLPHLVGDAAKLTGETGFHPTIEIERTLADLLEEVRRRPSPTLEHRPGN
jgi:GDP-4-dehydro-6-deoxy-D-mannose reductase